MATNDLLMYVDPFNLGQPNFLLQSGSELKSGSIWPQTGINERNNNAFAASVYPNPVSSYATISLLLDKSQELSVNIYDLTGHKIAAIEKAQYGTGENTIRYDASALPKGMYFIQITDGVKSTSLKMIVK
jgi:hypothetical protein